MAEGMGTVGITAQRYIERGWAPIPVPFRAKKPILQQWQNLRLTAADLPQYFNGGPSNLGVLLGEASRGLVDVDQDIVEARVVAPYFLPRTASVFGRKGNPRSHWLYIADPAFKTYRYLDPTRPDDDDGAAIVEFRSTGGQTIFPPSTHKDTGESIAWDCDGEPTLIDGRMLLAGVRKIAAAALLARHWPGIGARHDAALALAGGLINAGWAAEDVGTFLEAVTAAAGDDEPADRIKAAETTAKAVQEGRKFTGWPTLSGIIDRRITDKVCEWLGITFKKTTETVSGDYAWTDLGNAERFAVGQGERFRYVEQWGWLTYDGKRWARDLAGERFRAAKAVVRAIYGEAAECLDDERRKALVSWARRSESQARLDSMLTLARWEPPITARAEHFDADAYLLNAANGLVDLRTGELQPHTPESMVTKLAPVPYQASAKAPLFEHFLAQIIPSAEVRHYLQVWSGYSTTGSTREERLSVWYGSGRNGKTTLARIIQYALGDYAKQVDPEILMEHRNEQHPTGRAGLQGVRAAFASETAENSRMSTSTMKALVSNDRISARFMHQDFFEFEPTHSLTLLTNHKPEIRTTDEGTWRRLDLVPFTVTIREDEKDTGLPRKLQGEAAGVLAWIVAGAEEWLQSGLPRVEEITTATKEYRAESDMLGDFMTDRCVIGPQETVPIKDIYGAYVEWCEGSKEKPLGKTYFGRQLKERGFLVGRSPVARLWCGLRLRGLLDDDKTTPMTNDDAFSSIPATNSSSLREIPKNVSSNVIVIESDSATETYDGDVPEQEDCSHDPPSLRSHERPPSRPSS
jgi:P4 family phage/plasmid primase-like protien